MAKLIETIAETQTYFLNNFTETPVQVDGLKFSNDGLTQYIQIRYIPNDNEAIMGRIVSYGTLQVYCFHKVKNLCAVLADTVQTFAKDTDLPKGIRIKTGNFKWIRELENGYWCTLVQFPVEQTV